MSDPDSKAAPPATGSVIEARALTKTYGDVNVVDAINFDIFRGEVFGLLGPNGAGKTTTILMMLGLTEISSGTVSVLGFNPARQPLHQSSLRGWITGGYSGHELDIGLCVGGLNQCLDWLFHGRSSCGAVGEITTGRSIWAHFVAISTPTCANAHAGPISRKG